MNISSTLIEKGEEFLSFFVSFIIRILWFFIFVSLVSFPDTVVLHFKFCKVNSCTLICKVAFESLIILRNEVSYKKVVGGRRRFGIDHSTETGGISII